MAKKRKKKRTVTGSKSSSGGGRPTHWMIVAAIFVFFSAAFVLKMVFSPVSGEEKDFIRNRLRQDLSVDQVVQLVDKEYGHKIG